MAYKSDGSFVPTTQIWDVTEIYRTEVTSPAFKELLVRLYQNLNGMAISVNGRDAGMYDKTEFVNGQTFFPSAGTSSATSSAPNQRQVYRKVIDFGALPNAAAKTVAHGLTITTGYTFTRIYGTASNPAGSLYIPIPYASPVLLNNIELSVSNVNVTITTGIDRTAFTTCYVVLEYLKN
jgi:hypothetical protein